MQTRQPVPTYFGRYQVLEELGSGAMGVVYLCVDPRLARPVAVKVIRESEHMNAAEKEQFQALFQVLKGGQVFSVQDVCSIILQVADAIDYVHEHGIIHRDIKPANIMMT